MQLRQVLDGFSMRVADPMPAMTSPSGQVEANNGGIDAASAFEAY